MFHFNLLVRDLDFFSLLPVYTYFMYTNFMYTSECDALPGFGVLEEAWLCQRVWVLLRLLIHIVKSSESCNTSRQSIPLSALSIIDFRVFNLMD